MSLRAAVPGEQKSIKQLAQEKWKSSGISDKLAHRLRFQVLTSKQTAALGSNFHAAASLKIPYFDLKGKPSRFYRVRYLERLPGFAGAIEKPQRYVQLVGTVNGVYLPPLFKDTWEKIGADTGTALVVTEGELKSAAGCIAGFPTIGLGGVDVWRSAKKGLPLLPPLDRFKWEGRSVTVVFDSDSASNPNVVRAQRQLAGELLSRGSEVTIASIPATPDGKKQGLDDFLIANGGDALDRLIEDAAAFPESDALWQLNEEVVVIRDPGLVAERDTGRLMKVYDFQSLLYANRHYMETQIKGKKLVMTKKPLAPRWIEWEHRSEMERMTYAPGKPQEYEGAWNVWPGWGVEPKKGDVTPWQWLLDFMFKDDHKSRRWFERWCAYPLQFPGTKLYTAVMLWSRVKRIGKGLTAYSLMKIYGKNGIEVNNKSIKGDFNSWAKNRNFVFGDELKGSEAKIDADWLKNVITSETLLINEKNLPQYVQPNLINWLMASNWPDALFLEDGDMRYMVHEVIGNPAEREKYEWYDKWLKGSGPSHLFHHLLDLNLGDFNPREHAPDTPGKRSMVLLGKNDLGLWVHGLKEDPYSQLRPLGDGPARNCDLFSARQLYRAFDPEGRSRHNEAAMGRALVVAGFRHLNFGVPMQTEIGMQRLYAVRNVVQWEQSTPKEIKAHFNGFFGPNSAQKL